MVAPLQRALRIDQDVGNVLHVAYFMLTAAHFEQRVISGRTCVGWIEQQAMRETRAPPSGQLPVLPLDIVDHSRTRPRKEGRHDEPHAFAGTGGSKGNNVLRPVVP